MATELERAFRREWPHVLATLMRYTGDLELAEDSVQEAFTRALSAPRADVLRNPAGWVTTVAKRIAIDAVRHDAALARKLPLIAAERENDNGSDMRYEAEETGDDRLELIFMACHEELSPETRLAVALRWVCGVPTEDIAAVLLVKKATMAARLTRARQHIARTGIRLGMPDQAERAERLDDVLTTIHLLYTVGHTTHSGTTLSDGEVASTALALAQSVHTLVPDESEATGLLALLLLTEARATGRLDDAGNVVSLEDADRSRWRPDLIREGLDLATLALPGGGRFALQAGISGLHSQAPSWVATDWPAIVSLYDALATLWPAPSVLLGRIVAHSFLDDRGPGVALAELDALAPSIEPPLVAQAYAVRGDLQRRIGNTAAASAAYGEALRLEQNEAVRGFLERRIREAGGSDQ